MKHLMLISGLATLFLVHNQNCFAEPVDYVRDIKPILTRHCLECHGRKEQENGLRLDVVATALAGGNSGPAIVAGKSGESLLIDAITGANDVAKMPPDGDGLSDNEIALLTRWVDEGAKAPAEDVPPIVRAKHWSFESPTRAWLPYSGTVRAQNAIDSFVAQRLEDKGLRPSPEADRSVLIRRLSLDLRGVPQTIDEVDLFLGDLRPDAYDRLVDRLLASPEYGERWGRHWLDVARYADSNGFTRDFGREIWKYRDWVINAVNADMPFDWFTIEQFAGDMLPDATLDQIIATGFHRNTLINEEGGTDQEQFRVDAVADRVATTGVAYLGLTLGCARCHDHKYDPISQREYYQLFAFFNNCDEPTIDAPSDRQVESGELKLRDEIRNTIAELEKQLKEMDDQFLAAQLAWERTITPEQRSRLPGPLQAALDKSPENREEAEIKMIRDHFKRLDVARKHFPIVDQIGKLQESEPTIPTTMVMRERLEPRKTRLHRRGNFLDEGALVEPTVPAVLHSLPAESKEPDRLRFARWLVSKDNPLTPRVVMNRHWQHFFGRGIVKTENDFGTQGILPSHPELLDWLAVDFADANQWSVKRMHRFIVTSATYRQSSRMIPELLARDPYNKLLARQSRARLEAEIIRDSALGVSGLLTRKIGGPSVHPPQPEGIYLFTQDPKPWNTDTSEDRYRRGMYTHFWRSSPYPSLMAFDFPNSNVTCTRRVHSNTPIQSLVLANDVQFVECARALAIETIIDENCGWDARIEVAFRKALGRRPTAQEQKRLLTLITEQMNAFERDQAAAEQFAGGSSVSISTEQIAAWAAVCRVLLNLDEFVIRE